MKARIDGVLYASSASGGQPRESNNCVSRSFSSIPPSRASADAARHRHVWPVIELVMERGEDTLRRIAASGGQGQGYTKKGSIKAQNIVKGHTKVSPKTARLRLGRWVHLDGGGQGHRRT